MRYSDLKLLDDMRYFDGKDVYIYGTGDFGFRAARMLDKIGIFDYTFCNSNRAREGTKKLGNRIVHPSRIPDRDSSVVIIAVSPQNKQYVKEMERELSTLSAINTISYFSLELFCDIFDLTREGDLECMMDQSIAESAIQAWQMRRAKAAVAADILVYQPAKVASVSVYNGIVHLGFRSAHIHNLNRFIQQPSLEIQWEYEKLLQGAMKGKKLITLVREPIARHISGFFQLLNGISRWLLQRSIADKGFQSALRELMLSTHDELETWYGNGFLPIETWFENEFLPVTGIDVFRHPFDVDKGYTVIRENGIEVLLMTMESLPYLEGVIGEFIGNSDFKLPKENVSTEKEYAKLYKETLDTVEIPREFFDHYYKDSPFMKHFYSQADIERFAARWRSHVRD